MIVHIFMIIIDVDTDNSNLVLKIMLYVENNSCSVEPLILSISQYALLTINILMMY